MMAKIELYPSAHQPLPERACLPYMYFHSGLGEHGNRTRYQAALDVGPTAGLTAVKDDAPLQIDAKLLQFLLDKFHEPGQSRITAKIVPRSQFLYIVSESITESPTGVTININAPFAMMVWIMHFHCGSEFLYMVLLL